MDLDGNGNHGLEDLWGQDEEKFDIPVVSSPPPMRSTGFLLLLTSGLAGQVHLFQHYGVCSICILTMRQSTGCNASSL
jgi:hypothetical protein